MAYVALVGSTCGIEGEEVPFIEQWLALQYISDGVRVDARGKAVAQ